MARPWFQVGCSSATEPQQQGLSSSSRALHSCPAYSMDTPIVCTGLQWYVSDFILEIHAGRTGGRELKGLQCHPLCDRQKVDVPKSQLTFLEYVVRPTFEGAQRLCAHHVCSGPQKHRGCQAALGTHAAACTEAVGSPAVSH